MLIGENQPRNCNLITFISGAVPLTEDGLMDIRLVKTNGSHPGNNDYAIRVSMSQNTSGVFVLVP